MKLNLTARAVLLALSSSALITPTVLAEQVEQGIETIVVRGQKIDRGLQDTPNSVAVVTEDDLEKLHLNHVADIFSSMPNVNGSLGQGYSIRGIAFDNVSGGGNSFLTSMYVDGASLPFRLLRMGTLSVWDLAQVEVFRGPQSTLQGRNSLAGTIVIRTEDPTYEWGGKAKVTYGQDGQQEFAFAGGGALIDDMLAFRVSVEDRQLDGANYNITRHEHSNYQEAQNLRAKLLFEPTDTLSAIFTVSHDKGETGAHWVKYYYGEDPYDRTVDFNSPIWQKTDTDIYTLELDWELNDHMSLKSITTYNDSEYSYNWDGDISPQQLTSDHTYTRTDKTKSQELRLVMDYDRVQAVVGLYASDLDADDLSDGERLMTFSLVGLPPLPTLLGAPQSLGGFGLPPELVNAVVPLYPDIDPIMLGIHATSEQSVDTQAIFADATIKLTDNFDLLAGFRYDKEEQKNGSVNQLKINNTLPDPSQYPQPLSSVLTTINGQLNQLATSASGAEIPSEADFDAFLPKLGLSYHFNDDISTSFIYQKAYRSGGVGFNIAKSYLFTYDAEYTDNYELSLRSVWLDGDLVVNTNLFYLDWSDQQVSVQNSSARYDRETVNAGESEVKGFETEIYYTPSRHFSLTAGLGYAKSKFTDFQYQGKDLKGRSFADSPEWTGNITANYEFDSGVFASVNANYAGSSYAYLDPTNSLVDGKTDINGDPKNDARWLLNAQVGYEWQNYTVRLDVKNLLDEEYVSTYFSNADNRGAANSYGQMELGAPRQVSLTLQAAF